MTDAEEEAITHRFNIFDANRYFHTNSQNEPNIFVLVKKNGSS